jgi:hypothetical protein
MNEILKFLVLAFIFCSCDYCQECNNIESNIKGICVKTDSLYTISLSSLTSFEWDILYVIQGPTIDDEVDKFIGIRYNKVIQDNRRQYIYVKGNMIVKEYSSYCDFNLSAPQSYTLGHKYFSSTVIKVQKKEGEGHFIYRVEIP